MELNFYERIVKIQSELKAPKGQRNDFGKYNYRSCEDIFEAVKPLLAKYNLILTAGDELVELGGRIYVKATVRIRDDKGNSIENTAYAREEETKKGMDGSQITGASSSYARKYALNGLFLIDDTKDSDATNTHGKEEPKAEPKKEEPKATETQIKKIKELLGEERVAKMLTWFKISKIEELTLSQASSVIEKEEKGDKK